jgi:alpha-amylase
MALTSRAHIAALGIALGLASCASRRHAITDSFADLAGRDQSVDAWRGRSAYFVVTDRYANGDSSNDNANGFNSNLADPSAWHGGDFAGLASKLDYIAGMGFTALWITPVITQHSVDGYHGYYGWDWRRIDGHLGDMKKLASLVKAAHARGIAVLIDTVANHTGRYDDHAPSFPERSMYHHNGDITDWNDPKQLENFDLKGLNDLDQDNPRVRRALLDHVRWLLASTGADGLRVDTVKHVPATFWLDYAKAASVFTLGEVLDGDVHHVAPYSHALDATLDYPLYYRIKDVFARGQSARALASLFAEDSAYRDPLLNGVFVDNHDQPRFPCNAAAGKSAAEREQDLRLALAFSFTVRGIPILYYGTEQGLTSCANNREDMVRFDANAPLYKYVAQLNKARNRALKLGPQLERWQDDTAYAFERESGDSVALVTFNLGAEARAITMQHMHAPAGTLLIDAMGGAASVRIGKDLSVTVTVPARSVLILTAN